MSMAQSTMTVVAKKSVRCASRLAIALVFCACGEGELESVTIVDGICTFESRLAILVTIDNPDQLEIDSVTAKRTLEQHCFLEARPRWRLADDAGESEGTLYSCWEQGTGTYQVRVKSGDRTWTETVDVPGDDCHIAKVQKITFELE
jgi:hypothetical protein